jgi:hypothetical protein
MTRETRSGWRGNQGRKSPNVIVNGRSATNTCRAPDPPGESLGSRQLFQRTTDIWLHRELIHAGFLGARVQHGIGLGDG